MSHVSEICFKYEIVLMSLLSTYKYRQLSTTGGQNFPFILLVHFSLQSIYRLSGFCVRNQVYSVPKQEVLYRFMLWYTTGRFYWKGSFMPVNHTFSTTEPQNLRIILKVGKVQPVCHERPYKGGKVGKANLVNFI